MKISIIIPAHNAGATLRRCLEAVYSCQGAKFECIVVDDSSTDATSQVAGDYPVQLVMMTGGPYGPAEARNRGAQQAVGEILLFLDADVLLPADGLIKIALLFEMQPGISAAFGSYDDAPEDSGFLSQYKNLTHHYVHQSARQNASTFWSGCGAIRESIFSELGGFDSNRYPRPSIEDIELGTRLIAAGHEIRLLKDLQVKHLKCWSLAGLIKTDVLHRGIPWTRLILRNRKLPNDLNLTLPQRFAALLAVLLVGMLIAGLVLPNGVLLPLAILLYLLVIDWMAWDQPSTWQPAGCRPLPAAALATGCILLGLISGNQWLPIPPVVVLIAALTLLIIGKFSLSIRRVYFIGVYFVAFGYIIIVLAFLPVWYSLGVLTLLAGVAIVNMNMLQYFSRLRGIFFTFAVFLMHIFYYWYSMIALITALIQHLFSGKREKRLA